MKLCCSFIDSHQIKQVGDSVCLILLTPLATVSAYLCSSGASYYAKQGQVAEAVSSKVENIPSVYQLSAGGS